MASQGKVARIRSSKEAERMTENQVLRVQVQERNRRKIPHDCLSANFRNITCVDLAKTDLNGLVFSNTSDISGVICCCFFMLSISFLCLAW
jgi:hypothetical protein